MAVYEMNGSRYEIPDDVQGEQLQETLMLLSEQTAPQQPEEAPQAQPEATPNQPYQSGYGPVAKSIDPDILTNSPDWLKASRSLYKMNHGKDFEGQDAELAEWGLDFMGFFNYNLPAMAVDTARVSNASQEVKDSFLYMMDTYDNLDMSWGGAGRFFKGVLTDPTTYVGLGTLGVGLAGKVGAKEVGKQGLKATLKQSLGRTGIVAGVEGAMYGAADNTMRQTVEVSAGRKKEISGLDVAKAAGIGTAVGVVGGTAIDAAATGIRNGFRNMRDAGNPNASRAASPDERVEPTLEQPASIGAPTSAATAEPKPPISVFHGTKAGEDQVPTAASLNKSADLGPHFTTTEDTAKLFADDGGSPGRVLKAELSVENPLEMPDLATWDPGTVANYLDEAGLTGGKADGKGGLGKLGTEILSAQENLSAKLWDEQPEEIQALRGKFNRTPEEAAKLREIQEAIQKQTVQLGYDILKKWFKDNGYDSIKYTNKFEGKPVDTYIALDMSKVRDTPKSAPQGQPEALPPPSRDVLPISPSREVGSEGAIRAEVDGIIDPKAASEMTPSRSLENPIPFIPRNMEEITHFARSLGEELKGLHYTQAEDVLQDLKTTKMTQAEWGDFNRSTQIAVDDLRLQLADVIKQVQSTSDPRKLEQLAIRQAELEDLLAPVAMVDEAFSSMTGSMLRQRQEGLTELRGLSPESIMKETGVSRAEAEAEYVSRVERAAQTKEGKAATREYDDKIQKALADGNTMEASRWATLRQMHMGAIAGNDVRMIHKLNEYVISNVFSATTLAVNIVPSLGKTLYRPALNALLSNPLEAVTRRQTAATYSAMKSSIGGAWRAAKASFRYEQALLTRDAGRLAEGELAITGKKAEFIRIFPRLLNATDEFLSQINYHGYIAGDAAGAAYEAGVKEGLKGKQLDDYVKGRVKSAIERSYTSGDDQAALAVILNKGVNLNLKGEDLMTYVQRELTRDPKAIRHGNNEEAVNYVRDVLYKRAFSGENTSSKIAKRYEQMVNEAPVIRLIGQLFFRTPVRVFEEGIRMTPGLQIVAPNFLKDLAGKNGRRSQVRAQGEAMMSLAFTGTILSLYAQGKITGDGAYSDWKQQRNRTDSDMPEPYTLKFDDGSTWSFRSFDPISTPMKIIVNALERYENLHLRETQGEFIAKSEWDRVMAGISVGAGAIGTAIRDANLMGGLNAAMELGEDAMDPERNEGAFVKFMGDKLRTLVPNTLHKIAKTNDPTMDDPKTFWQMVESRVIGGASLGSFDKTGPKSYDFLGNVRQANDTDALWNIFSQSTLEERKKGLSETELDVLRKLDYVSKQTGVSFVTPYVHKMTGRMDLRTEMTADGKETLYDRWNRYYKALNPQEGLSDILNAGLPVGTTSVDGATVTTVRNYVNTLRDAAFYQLMSEEVGVSQKVFDKSIREAEVKAGFWDR